MAELALIAGMNYFGEEKKKSNSQPRNKKTNDQIILDDHKNTPYHTDSVRKVEKEQRRIHAKRRNDMDSTKYMIPSYYIHEDGDAELGMGINNDDEEENEQSFLDQFELQKVSNKKVKASNEGKHGNMSCLSNKWSSFNDGDDMT